MWSSRGDRLKRLRCRLAAGRNVQLWAPFFLGCLMSAFRRKIVAPKANCQTIVFGSNLRNIRLRGGVPGGRDVESRSCRSDSTLHLHFVRNSPVGSLVAPGNRGVVHGRRVSGDWSSPHCRERSGCSSQGASPRVPARVLRVQLWNVPAVRDIPVWIRVSAPVRIRASAGVAI